MATYQIECEPCEIYWEVERPMGKPPKKAKCPQCGKMGNRCWTTPGFIFQGMDFETNRAQADRYGRYGMDKDTANQFLNDSIKLSKERMKDGKQSYKDMVLDAEHAIKTGMAKRVDKHDKQKAKAEVAKTLVTEAEKRLGKN